MEEESVLEEGEISDDVEDYTPIERPTNYAVTLPLKRFPETVRYSDSEEEFQSSDSDSDSDGHGHRNKKPKIKLKPKPVQRYPKQKKYDIWSTRAQEDVLAETLNSCDVTSKDRSRDVESYDYTLGSKYYADLEERTNNKRTRDDRKNAHFRPRKRSNSSEKVKGKERIIESLGTDLSNSPEEIATDMANKLFEEREDLILKVVDAMGKEKTIEIFKETKRIEKDGGMLIMNQTRRRTPGGVFFFLVRHDYHITPEQKQKIFGEEKLKQNKAVKEKRKAKLNQIKIANANSRSNLIPDLLTRAELLACQNPTRKLKQTEERDVINPPPSPETDHHENSTDGMEENASIALNKTTESGRGTLQTYDDDFLDLGCSNEMDLF